MRVAIVNLGCIVSGNWRDPFLNGDTIISEAGRLVSGRTDAALTSPQIVAAPATSSGPGRYYGFGFGVGTWQGQRWFGHNGGTLGANAEFAVFPKERLTLTVLANRDPPMASAMFAYVRALALNPSLRATCQAGDLR